MENELFDSIREALEGSLRPATPDEHTFVLEVAVLASKAASEHAKDLNEAISHLQETVKRLSKLDTGTVTS